MTKKLTFLLLAATATTTAVSTGFHSQGCFFVNMTTERNASSSLSIMKLDGLIRCAQTCAARNSSYMALKNATRTRANCSCVPQSAAISSRLNSDCTATCLKDAFPCGSLRNTSLLSLYKLYPTTISIPDPSSVNDDTGAVSTLSSDTSTTTYSPGTTDQAAIQRKWALYISTSIAGLILTSILIFLLYRAYKLHRLPSRPRICASVGDACGVPGIPTKTYTCHTMYSPVRSDEIRLDKDDVVQVIQVVQEGKWVLSNNLSSSHRGIHPLACLAPNETKGAIVFPKRNT